ncbi:hypothetical protein EOM82_05520 [bacterium]|nr:hypothetical protein [bacterium]
MIKKLIVCCSIVIVIISSVLIFFFVSKNNAKTRFQEYMDTNFSERIEVNVYYSFKTNNFQADCINEETGHKYFLFFDDNNNICMHDLDP